MSQELVFNLLQNLGGDATISEINAAAKQKYPNRSIDSYTTNRLKSLKKKGVVDNNLSEDETLWQIVDDNPQPFSINLNQIDQNIDQNDLSSFGLSICNIVATVELGTNLDLYNLAEYLEKASYEPESNSALIYRPPEDSSVTFMIPSSGRITIVGAKKKKEIELGINSLIEKLGQIGYDVQASPHEAIIRNLVVVGNLGQEVDLAELAVYLGMEQTEYDINNFPGLMYRSENQTTILYRSGKYIITGLGDYQSVLDAARQFIHELPDEVATVPEGSNKI